MPLAPVPRPTPLTFADGESVPFLGEVLTLRVRHGLPRRAERRDTELVATLPPPDIAGPPVRRLVYAWFAARARELFPTLVEDWRRRADEAGLELGGPVRSITVRPMASRWGSCSIRRRHITFDTFLLQAPRECVDYVVLHELCHLREPNHSPRFYALVERLMPDWKSRRRALRAYDARP